MGSVNLNGIWLDWFSFFDLTVLVVKLIHFFRKQRMLRRDYFVLLS